jgi:hypothetical protein
MAHQRPVLAAASSCREQLQAMADANILRQNILQYPGKATWPAELLARFEYLASDIGFFEHGSYAVDQRLRSHDLVRIMVVQYLDAIASNAGVGTASLLSDYTDPFTEINWISTPNLYRREPTNFP